MTFTRKMMLSGATAAAAAFMAMPASATIIMVDASSIQGDNVLFNDGDQTGTSVVGKTQSGTTVTFTGGTLDGGTVLTANGGQARVGGALDTSTPNPNDTLGLTDISFMLADGKTFNDLEFNLFSGTPTGQGANAVFPTVSFSLFDNMGTEFQFGSDANPLTVNQGENMFAFQGIDGQSISKVVFHVTGDGFQSLRQVRLTEVAGLAGGVPEPASWAMMIIGFGAIGASMRMRKRVTVRSSFSMA